MKYKVHRLEIDLEKDQERLENFLNNLKGEVVSIIPHIAKMNLFQIYGATHENSWRDWIFLYELPELILNEIEEADEELAAKIKQKMFVFENLVQVDDRGFQRLFAFKNG